MVKVKILIIFIMDKFEPLSHSQLQKSISWKHARERKDREKPFPRIHCVKTIHLAVSLCTLCEPDNGVLITQRENIVRWAAGWVHLQLALCSRTNIYMIIPSLECIRQNTPVICILCAWQASDVNFATMRPAGRLLGIIKPGLSTWQLYGSYFATPRQGKSNYGAQTELWPRLISNPWSVRVAPALISRLARRHQRRNTIPANCSFAW